MTTTPKMVMKNSGFDALSQLQHVNGTGVDARFSGLHGIDR